LLIPSAENASIDDAPASVTASSSKALGAGNDVATELNVTSVSGVAEGAAEPESLWARHDCDWCHRNHKPWFKKCTWLACRKCGPCHRGRNLNHHHANRCLMMTEGTCRIFGCSGSRGDTKCVGGKCVCLPGTCAVNGKCVRGCDKSTPGTCRFFGCSSSRGVTDCVDGKCVCAHGACSVDGVCYDRCPRATGGSCHVFGCSGSNVECIGGHCECRPGFCSVGGSCVALGATLAELQAPGDVSLVPAAAAAAAAVAGAAFVSIGAFMVLRRGHPAALEESLLAVEAKSPDA